MTEERMGKVRALLRDQLSALIYPMSLCDTGPFLPPQAVEDVRLGPELFDQVGEAWLLV